MKEYKCPKCGEALEHIRMFNEELMGIEDNPFVGWICRNEQCKGWFCEYCNEWHSYGTSCCVAMIRNMRSGTSYPTHDSNWHHSEQEITVRDETK